MKSIDLIAKFLEHAVLEKGKDTMTVGSYWYRDRVMFYNTTPAWRVVGTGKKKVLLIHHIDFNLEPKIKGKLSPDARPELARKLEKAGLKVTRVPDLGVFSVYAEDLLDDEGLMERMRFIMLSRMRDLVETDMVNLGAPALEGKEGNRLRELLVKHYQEYDDFNNFAHAGWKDAPRLYLQKFDDTRKQKILDFNDPKNVTKRERAQARRIASKALGLTT